MMPNARRRSFLLAVLLCAFAVLTMAADGDYRLYILADCDPGDDDDDDEVYPEVDRMVMAGDSWSAGLVYPTIDALADQGFGEVALSYNGTAVPGSKAEQFANNEASLMDILEVSLDVNPPADVLLLVIGGNDLLSDIADGFGGWADFRQNNALDDIADDINTIIDKAQEGRPNLRVVIVGYDYLHWDFSSLAYGLKDMNTQSFNEAFVALEQRKLDIAQSRARVEYAHNFGILQRTYGDTTHPPFLLPPLPYDPGVAPRGGYASEGYEPFPGGAIFYPSPLDRIPDGIHPTADGFRVIIDNTFTQGLENILDQLPWATTAP